MSLTEIKANMRRTSSAPSFVRLYHSIAKAKNLCTSFRISAPYILNQSRTDDEIVMMESVLSLSEKKITSIMTPLHDVFALPLDFVMDEPAIDMVIRKGYSRIPIHSPGMPPALHTLTLHLTCTKGGRGTSSGRFSSRNCSNTMPRRLRRLA